MSGADDFLSRWSRRKREAKRPDPGEAPAPAPEQDTADPFPAEDQEPATPAETEPPPDLPHPEDLTADSDLSAFFREGIPERLRNAALRRMWSLDPNIRDFVGDARDYAYDWNSPGGVPGFGPILPGDDVKAMVAAIFGTSDKPEAEAEVPVAAASGPASTELPEVEESPREIEVDAEPAAAPVEEGTGGGEVEAPHGPLTSTLGLDPTRGPGHEIASPPPEARLRRHGGAKPV